MRKRILFAFLAALFIGLLWFKWSGESAFVWNISRGGTWLFPLVAISALLDSIHPCSFSILLLTIAFLFGLNASKGKILAFGGVYIAGIFLAYLLIGLGIFQALHLFSTPHFMGKLGAALLILFGALNLLNRFFPRFPLRLALPKSAHGKMARLMEKASLPAAFGLGILVGACQFPCMGGPYLMVIGLLKDTVTYAQGFGYLLFYNALLIVPLVAVLFIAADRALLDRVQSWKKTNIGGVRLWGGILMIMLGILVIFL